MNSLMNIIDISKIYLGIASIVFIIVTVIAYYVLKMNGDTESENDEENGWKTIVYPILFGILSSFGSLVIFKYAVKDNCDILTDPFCSKINIG
jgi:RsiW-degrading membrane proteinase PrsW (M82 family)